MSYRILLVDDDIPLLHSVAAYLSSEGFLIDTTTSVSAAISMLRLYHYNLVISDIMLPESTGYDLIQYMTKDVKYKQIPFIFLTAKGMTQDRILGYDMGCYGYLTKPFEPAELVSLIRNLISKYSVTSDISKLDPSTASHLDTNSKLNQIYRNLLMFTRREEEVLELVLQGLTNKEIAFSLGVTVRSIEKHVSRLLTKTGTRNRTHLSQYIFRLTTDLKGE
uniref:TctD-like protein n=1 Tax=Yamadaella caenomyce TaxID=259029 RepID=A0A1G4NYZ9_9FLOR|nr:Hypothetical protein ycf29 [Yamadaella caenomyce]SCW23888.1 Hypothetical protein ycf29 [Yamadaella caenomyce]